MSRRKRVDPFDEGVLKIIYEKFFRKIVEVYCPEERTHKEFLEDLFDVDNRHIVRYRATRPFAMPGLLVLTGNVKVQGIGYRQVAKGVSVLVRTDAKQPAEIHVDFFGGQGNAEHVYSLTEAEWSWLQQHLTPQEDARCQIQEESSQQSQQ